MDASTDLIADYMCNLGNVDIVDTNPVLTSLAGATNPGT